MHIEDRAALGFLLGPALALMASLCAAPAAAEQAARTDIGWGHQIRSYVLQPYQMVKDLRTGVTSGTPQDVLDGDLDPFMEAALAQRAYGGGPGQVEDVD